MPDIATLRADTPGCQLQIHLNNAGAALPPETVLQTMMGYLETEARYGGYEVADQYAKEIAGFYSSTARLVRAEARNMAFTDSATDAYARALSAIPFRAGDVVLTTENDYVSNQIAFLALQKRFGIRLLRARDQSAGGVDVEDMERLIRTEHPVLVAVTHIPTNSGLVQPVEPIGAVCRELGIWYLVDACQSAGQLDLDVSKIGCDFLTATFRKFMRGPRGAGFMYVSDRVLQSGLEMLIPDMRSANWTGPDTYVPVADALRFEHWEKAPALMLGAKAATDYALQTGMEWIEARVKHIADFTRAQLRTLPNVRVLDHGERLCGIVTSWSPDWDNATLLSNLKQKGINARISGQFVAQIDFPRKNVPWALRYSPHYYNTEEEIVRAVEALK